MSTSYYRLRDPFTSIRVEHGPAHDHVSIWEDGELAGTLTVSLGVGSQLALLFAEDVDDAMCPVRTHWGGSAVGAVVTIQDRHAPDSMVVVSEYGEVLTMGGVKARAGARRADGFPTELFGYEPTMESKE